MASDSPVFSDARLSEQYKRICDHEIFSKATQLKEILGYLLQAAETGQKVSAKDVVAVIAKPTKAVDDPTAGIRQSLRDIRLKLREYYSGPGKEDQVIIEVRRGTVEATYGPRDSSEKRERAQWNDRRGLEPYAKIWHSYHMTKDDNGAFWTYTILDFRDTSSRRDDKTPLNTLVTTGLCLPNKRGKKWSRKQVKDFEDENRYQFQATLANGSLVIQSVRLQGPSDIAVKVFYNPLLLLKPIAGIMIITNTWAVSPAIAMTLISKKPLPYVKGTEDGEPIRSKQVMKALEDEWKKRCTLTFDLLLPAERWKAVPDVSNPRWLVPPRKRRRMSA